MKFLRRLRIKSRAQKRGEEIIGGRMFPSTWSKWDNRQLIRLNRLADGLPAFKWDGKPRRVNGVFECQVSLHAFGNCSDKPGLPESVRDLVAFNAG